MPQWMQDLTTGWPVIRANLPTFAVILLLMLAGMWWFVNYVLGGIISNRDSIISNKDSEIALLRSQRDEYKNKLSGATPDEARAKIEALEDKIRNTIGDRWDVLTKEEAKKLSELIAPIPKRRIQVMYLNYLGKDLARNIADVFEQAGWDVAYSEGGGLGEGVSTGRGNGAALTLKAAIEAATRLKVGSIRPDEKDGGLLFVAVGIKTR
jgi:hypothetical protein